VKLLVGVSPAGFAIAAGVTGSGKEQCRTQDSVVIVMHGGTARAGQVPEARLLFMRKVLNNARADLRRGATALDTVEDVITQMENSGLFNAGRAAIHNAAGFVETDASIMDGRTRNAGAVASMRTIKNPISAARLVMDKTRHVMMVGDRGEAAVTALGAQTVPTDYFVNNTPAGEEPEEHGTVGAAILDRCGNLAAGTSTGGYDAKTPGRVGDSPIIGAGVYAQNGVMAASATGHGEYFIRFSALKTTAARMEFGGEEIATAARSVIDTMNEAGTGNEGRDGRGGIVAVDASGNIAMPFSTDGMVRGYASSESRARVGVFDEMK